MNVDNKVQNLEEVLKNILGKSKSLKKYKVSHLVPPGENDLSEMLKIEIKLNNEENNEEEDLSVVAKSVLNHPDAPSFMKHGNKFIFRNEITFYDCVVPMLQQFQRDQGIEEVFNCFPKLYGYRRNLSNADEEFDDHALLLFEDLTVSGYQNIDRFVGFDLDTTKMILENLASFAAIPIAMRLLNEKLFTEKFKPNLEKGMQMPPLDKMKDMPKPTEKLAEILFEYEEFLPYVTLLKENMERKFKSMSEKPTESIFLTISHNDFWVNNIMTKFQDGKPIKNKFVDFQMISYRSATEDLFFFLWSSVNQIVLEENVDELIKFYYDKLIDKLQKLNCDTSIFTINTFMEELKKTSEIEFGHVIFMTFGVILRQKGRTESDRYRGPEILRREDVTLEARKRVLFIIRECSKRGWHS